MNMLLSESGGLSDMALEMLIARLKYYTDNKEYISGIISNLVDEEGFIKMIDFIDMSKNENEEISVSDLILLSVIIGNEKHPQEYYGGGGMIRGE